MQYIKKAEQIAQHIKILLKSTNDNLVKMRKFQTS